MPFALSTPMQIAARFDTEPPERGALVVVVGVAARRVYTDFRVG
jgi:hypothetical protein